MNGFGCRNVWPAVVLTLAAASCTMMKPSVRPHAKIEGQTRSYERGEIVDLSARSPVSFTTLMAQLRTKDVICIGEAHDNPDHHLVQTQILQVIRSDARPWALALEVFQRPQQSILDRYLAGDLDEETFLDELNWKRNWGVDYRFYRPLIQLAKESGAPILAMNAPRKTVKKVAREGLDALTTEERSQLTGEIDLSDEKHRERLRAVFEMHAHGRLKNFEHFYQAQCVWDDTMADTVAAHVAATGNRVVVVAGNGHILHRNGIPDRVQRRIPADLATVVPLALSGPLDLSPDAADFVWLTK